MENYRDIKGFEGRYKVSDLGNILSLGSGMNMPNGGFRMGSNKLLKLETSKLGYKRVTIYKPERKRYLVHRIVAQQFIPNPEGKPCVNHKNGIKSDNSINNLEWTTHKENTRHAFKVGLMKGVSHPMPKEGENLLAISVFQLTKNGDFVKKWDSVTSAAKSLKGSVPNICAVAKGKNKTAYGFKWKYA